MLGFPLRHLEGSRRFAGPEGRSTAESDLIMVEVIFTHTVYLQTIAIKQVLTKPITTIKPIGLFRYNKVKLNLFIDLANISSHAVGVRFCDSLRILSYNDLQF